MSIQDFGEKFDLQQLFRARDLARNLVYELSSLIQAGMTEDEAHKIYKDLCFKKGIEKQWHPPKIRFGPNTICNFKDVSLPYTLKEEDIFFIDIGPVIEGHEADYGETFVIGDVYEEKLIADSAREVYEEVSKFWKETNTIGPELYEYAQTLAAKKDFILNLNQDGHRIGDFPHHIFFRGGITECEQVLISNAWILEIHLLKKNKMYGAFFEDILTK